MPIVVSGHEDRYIRFFDINSGSCSFSMLSHLDAVSSLDIDPTGLVLCSGGHDGSVRLWDLASASKPCLQEFTGHRRGCHHGEVPPQLAGTVGHRRRRLDRQSLYPLLKWSLWSLRIHILVPSQQTRSLTHEQAKIKRTRSRGRAFCFFFVCLYPDCLDFVPLFVRFVPSHFPQ